MRPVLLVGLLTLAQAFVFNWGQTDHAECTVVQNEELESIIAEALTLGESGQAPDIRVLDSHPVCLAAGCTRNRYRFASVVVSLNCSGSLPAGNPLGISSCNGEFTMQLILECDDNGRHWKSNNVFYPALATFDTPPRTNCSFCDAQSGDAVTHCKACHDTCSGLGLCIGARNDQCCNFYQENKCVLQCNATEGYEANGTECVQMCPELTDPANGQVDVPSRTINSVAAYSCNTGYNIIGDATRTCEEAQESSGRPAWSGVCKIVDCGIPPAIKNATRNVTGTISGETATYVCDAMYQLVNSSEDTLTCGTTGNWEGPLPVCVMSCDLTCQSGDCVDGVCVCPTNRTKGDCGESPRSGDDEESQLDAIITIVAMVAFLFGVLVTLTMCIIWRCRGKLIKCLKPSERPPHNPPSKTPEEAPESGHIPTNEPNSPPPPSEKIELREPEF